VYKLWIAFFLGVSFSVCGCSPTVTGSNVFGKIDNSQDIPSGKSSYTLLLFTNDDISSRYTNKDLNRIINTFKKLGAAVGNNNFFGIPINKSRPNYSLSLKYLDLINKRFRNSGNQLKWEKPFTIVFFNFDPNKSELAEYDFCTAIQFQGNDIDLIVDQMYNIAQYIKNNNIQFEQLENQEFWFEVKRHLNKIDPNKFLDFVVMFFKK
jgi:hypothetical protein